MTSRARLTIFMTLMLASMNIYGQELKIFDRTIDSTAILENEYVWQLEEAPTGELQGYFKSLTGSKKISYFKRKDFRPKTNHQYWFAYSVRNSTGSRSDIGLDAWSDKAEFYILRKNGRIDSCTTGAMVPWSEKHEFRQSNVCTVSMDTAETVTILYKAIFKTATFDTSFKIAILSPYKLAKKDLTFYEKYFLKDDVTKSNFYAGLFAMASLVYFFFYFLVREKLYLNFGIFVALLALSSSRLLYMGLLEYPGLRSYFFLPFTLSLTAFTWFYREYFKTRINVPVWDKVCVALALTPIVVNLYSALFDKPLFEWLNPVLFILLIIVLVAIVPFRLKNNSKETKHFLLYATLPFLLLIPVLVIAFVAIKSLGQSSYYGSLIMKFFESANTIQLLSLTWMVLYFGRTLIKRFDQQREQILMHETEKQNILLHQEQEKRQLMEQLNAELESKVEQRTAELNNSLKELKATQSQLIQSEKMASLGEMTAGIAHEIQNPLNFVNNFAEVNAELSEELRTILDKNITDTQAKQDVNALIDDMISNGEKIRIHGKRADSIVKNMLQHSRSGEGSKEPTDINALIEEFVKLSFHGFRAKDKSFNADFRINTDPSVGKVMAIGQNLGRVILNLVNNAFYAVHTKNKNTGDDYSPMVIVSTEKIDGFVRITIEDNGDGIPESIKEKVFQPFFTTKPTGEGTGLGLSISYDIITKGHQGSMKVESAEGKGTIFTIELPA